MANTQNASANIQASSVVSALNLLKPDELLKFFNMHNAGLESRAYLYSHTLGFSEPTTNHEFFHTEKGYSNAALQVTAQDTDVNGVSGTIGAGVAVEFTLTGDAATYIYVRLNDVVEFKNGVQGIVTAVNYTTAKFTVTPITATDVIPDSVLNDYIVISSRAFGEGSSVGVAAFTRANKKSGVTQIIKDKVGTTGSSLTDGTWIQFGNKGFYSVQLLDGELRHLRHIEGAFLHGQASANPVTDPSASAVAGAKAYTTKGLIATSKEGYDTTAATDLADFDAYSQHLISTGVSKNTPIYDMVGFDTMISINSNFYGQITDNSANLVKATDSSLFKASEAYGLFANFKYYNSMYTYMFEVNESWSDPTGFGATGFDYKASSLCVPITKVKDGMSGKYFGTLGTRYKSNNGVNRKFMLDTLDGFGTINGKTINEIDATNTVFLSEIGNQFMGSEQYIWGAAA